MSFDLLSAAVGAAVASLPAVAAGSVMTAAGLRRRAAVDPLTKVWNRKGLPQLHKAVSRRASRGSVALVILDVRHFKTINDTHGHGIGDGVLQRVAQRLADFPGTIGQPVRLGGDEFAAAIALQSHHQGQSYPHQIYQLHTALTGLTVAGPNTVVNVDVTVGAVIAHSGKTDLSGLLSAADTAMYAARRNGTSVHVVYGGLPTPSSRPATRRRDTVLPTNATDQVTTVGGAA